MNFAPFRAEHLTCINVQTAQRWAVPYLTAEAGRPLENGWAWSATCDSGVLACGGLLPIWPGRAAAWGVLSDDVTPARFLRLHRRVIRELDRAAAAGFRRIETEVDPRFPSRRAVRWAASLGFECEGMMNRFMPDGSDMMRMVRLR